MALNCVDSEQLEKTDAAAFPRPPTPPHPSATLLLLSHSFSHRLGDLSLPAFEGVGSGSTWLVSTSLRVR